MDLRGGGAGPIADTRLQLAEEGRDARHHHVTRGSRSSRACGYSAREARGERPGSFTASTEAFADVARAGSCGREDGSCVSAVAYDVAGDRVHLRVARCGGEEGAVGERAMAGDACVG